MPEIALICGNKQNFDVTFIQTNTTKFTNRDYTWECNLRQMFFIVGRNTKIFRTFSAVVDKLSKCRTFRTKDTPGHNH